MIDTVVVYKTKYGSTKKYAQWIASALKSDLFEASEVTEENLLKYNTIIFGGGLYASGILGISLINKAFEQLKDKNLIVFTVGLADPNNTDQFKPIIEKNFTKEMRQAIKVFHFRGAIDYKKLSFLHKSMMALLKNKVSKTNEEDRDAETKMMLETFGQVVDFSDETTVSPLIEYCHRL